MVQYVLVKVLFSPGIDKPRPKIEDYLPLLDVIGVYGYKIEFVGTAWSGYTLDQTLGALREQYLAHDPASTILAGFSLGAWLSILVAAEVSPAELWLFSPSAAFQEDLAYVPKDFRTHMGKKRLEVCARYQFSHIAPRIRARRTLIFMGESELPVLRNRCTQAAQQIPNARLFEIPSMKHGVDSPALHAKVREVLS